MRRYTRSVNTSSSHSTASWATTPINNSSTKESQLELTWEWWVIFRMSNSSTMETLLRVKAPHQWISLRISGINSSRTMMLQKTKKTIKATTMSKCTRCLASERGPKMTARRHSPWSTMTQTWRVTIFRTSLTKTSTWLRILETPCRVQVMRSRQPRLSTAKTRPNLWIV